MNKVNGTNGHVARVTAREFDADPRHVYERAEREGAVVVLDSNGCASMTIVVPRDLEPADEG